MSGSPYPVQPDAALRPPRMVRFELSLKSLFIILGVLAGIWLVVHALLVLLVLVTALMLVGALHPLVAWLEQRRMRRVFAIGLVFVVGTVVAGTLLALTVPTVIKQVKSVIENEPKIRETLASYLDESQLTAPLAQESENILKDFHATTQFLLASLP